MTKHSSSTELPPKHMGRSGNTAVPFNHPLLSTKCQGSALQRQSKPQQKTTHQKSRTSQTRGRTISSTTHHGASPHPCPSFAPRKRFLKPQQKTKGTNKIPPLWQGHKSGTKLPNAVQSSWLKALSKSGLVTRGTVELQTLSNHIKVLLAN